LNQLEDSSVLQKKYFLVASGKNATVVNQAIAILKEELLQANLLIKEATKEAVDICLSKLIPTIGENKTIKFFTRYYIINQNDKETYYKTFLIRALPKQVGQFWNQGLFNLDEATINIQYYGVTSEKIKKRYADKLNQLVADRKAKTMVDKSAKMQELQAIQDLADEIGIGGAKLKKVKYMITIQANTLKELNKKYGEVKNMIAHNKMKVNSC
jgi:type IV secretory pathway VirB4 component